MIENKAGKIAYIAGHLSPIEQPEAFNMAVIDYLKQEKFIL